MKCCIHERGKEILMEKPIAHKHWFCRKCGAEVCDAKINHLCFEEEEVKPK